jgi:hypothetical protein
MEHSTWEANSHSASQEIRCLSWNPVVRYGIYNNLPFVTVLTQTNPVHTFPPYFPKIHSNVILPSTSATFDWSLSFRFSDQDDVYISYFSIARHVRPSHPPWFHHAKYTRAVWKVRGLTALRRCYAEGGITTAYCRQSTNFSNGPRICSAILKRVLLKRQLDGWRSRHYYVTLTTTIWHNSHRFPLHNSGTPQPPPVHELFKRPSYIHMKSFERKTGRRKILNTVAVSIPRI